jgi:hypothetical protein
MPFPKTYPQQADDNLVAMMTGTQPINISILAESVYDIGGWVLAVVTKHEAVSTVQGQPSPVLSEGLKTTLIDKIKAIFAKLKHH